MKLRGHRIELEEIEHCLALHDAVRACAVLLDERRSGDPRLIAYVVFENGRTSAAESLGRHLRLRLPSYMVPDAFVALPALPLTSNGKLDRQALPAPGTSDARRQAARRSAWPEAAVDPPGNGRGECVQGSAAAPSRWAAATASSLWEDTHSMCSAWPQLGAATGRAVAVSDIFAAPSVAELSAVLKRRDDRVALPVSMVEVRTRRLEAAPLFPPGALGEIVVSEALVRRAPRRPAALRLSRSN